jgi:xylulokinase
MAWVKIQAILMASLLLGIDIGTYSSKGVLTTIDGSILKTGVVEHAMELPHPGWAEQDADALWWGDTVRLCQALLDGSPYGGEDVAGVALSAIGGCLLPVDSKGRPLRKGILYGVDTRASEEIDLLNQQLGEEAIFESSGMALTSQSVGPKILWVKRHEPEVWHKTAWVGTASSYLVFRMTGEKVIDRNTACYYTPLMDIHRLEWSPRFAATLLPLEKLPRLGWAEEQAGTVSTPAAVETGLKAGTPVAVGTIDSLAEAISVGVAEVGDLMVMYGSTASFNLVVEKPHPDRRIWTTGGAFRGQFNHTGGTATAGTLTRWFRDTLATGIPQQEAYDELFSRAALVQPGAGGLLMLPYFQGERTPIHDPLARGVITGLTLAHSRDQLFRVALEGVAFSIRHNIETIRSLGVPVNRLAAVGGGAKSPTWVQITSDVTGLAQVLPQVTLGASYGDAFLAGCAAGLLQREDIADWVKPRMVIEPNAALRPLQ